MDSHGLYGSFKNPDDINNFWYQVTEKELEEQIQELEADLGDLRKSMLSSKGNLKKKSGLLLEEPEITEKEFKEYEKSQKKQIIELELELRKLQDFVDNYHRCLERFNRNKKILKELTEDWHEYNISLWKDHLRIQRMMLDSSLTKGEGLKQIQRESKVGAIKQEEIERRIRKLLD